MLVFLVLEQFLRREPLLPTRNLVVLAVAAEAQLQYSFIISLHMNRLVCMRVTFAPKNVYFLMPILNRSEETVIAPH